MGFVGVGQDGTIALETVVHFGARLYISYCGHSAAVANCLQQPVAETDVVLHRVGLAEQVERCEQRRNATEFHVVIAAIEVGYAPCLAYEAAAESVNCRTISLVLLSPNVFNAAIISNKIRI